MSDNHHCYLIYSTANDDPMYVDDFFNFDDMARFHPGVPMVNIIVVVSQVILFSKSDTLALSLLRWRAESSGRLKVVEIIFKGNVGRDFSSVKCGLNLLQNSAKKDDSVMVRNRSSYGPTSKDWYKVFSRQYLKFKNTGLVGCTISLKGHPSMTNPEGAIHVQSYCYFSHWQHLENLTDDFPGVRSLNRISTIVDGEIELSKRIMNNGLYISCLNWPDAVFDSSMLNCPSNFECGPVENIQKIPFRYKIHRKSFRRPRGLLLGFMWIISMRLLSLTQKYLQLEFFKGNILRLYEYD